MLVLRGLVQDRAGYSVAPASRVLTFESTLDTQPHRVKLRLYPTSTNAVITQLVCTTLGFAIVSQTVTLNVQDSDGVSYPIEGPSLCHPDTPEILFVSLQTAGSRLLIS